MGGAWQTRESSTREHDPGSSSTGNPSSLRLVDTVVQRGTQQLGESQGSIPDDILGRQYPP
jgi:hypothetical protein